MPSSQRRQIYHPTLTGLGSNLCSTVKPQSTSAKLDISPLLFILRVSIMWSTAVDLTWAGQVTPQKNTIWKESIKLSCQCSTLQPSIPSKISKMVLMDYLTSKSLLHHPTRKLNMLSFMHIWPLGKLYTHRTKSTSPYFLWCQKNDD